MHSLSDLLPDGLSKSNDILHFRFTENGKSSAALILCPICVNDESISSIYFTVEGRGENYNRSKQWTLEQMERTE